MKQGKGNKPKKSQPLTDDEINMLYQKKLLGESTPESLLNTVWFNSIFVPKFYALYATYYILTDTHILIYNVYKPKYIF
jgi:hypothetical protein